MPSPSHMSARPPTGPGGASVAEEAEGLRGPKPSEAVVHQLDTGGGGGQCHLGPGHQIRLVTPCVGGGPTGEISQVDDQIEERSLGISTAEGNGLDGRVQLSGLQYRLPDLPELVDGLVGVGLAPVHEGTESQLKGEIGLRGPQGDQCVQLP